IFGLPWAWQESTFGLKFDMRLLASAGEIAPAGATGLMTTLVQCLAVSSPNGTVSLDIGGGAAFFSNYKFGVQNFGGPAQIVGTSGIGLNLSPGFYAGYRTCRRTAPGRRSSARQIRSEEHTSELQ